MTAAGREHGMASDPRRPHIAALACACLAAAAAVALATSPEHRDRRTASTPSGAADSEVRAAAAAARTFLDDYLSWLAGRRAPQRIRGASTALRRRLADNRIRPSRIARRRHARIAELHTQLTGPRAARAVARVLQADVPLAVELELERAPGGWEVTDAHS